MNEPVTRNLKAGTPPRALVRFAPDARVADITALLDSYQASIIDGAKGGLFQLQFGNKAMTKDEIANLMSRLQGEKIINLAVAAQMADSIGVMYLGRLVECGDAQTVLERPLHPYTRMLLEAVPDVTQTTPRRRLLPGEVPSAIHPPSWS